MSTNERDIDRIIDEVAREMTRADAPASMRGSVTARLEAGSAGRGVLVPRWAWGALAAAMVVLAVAGAWLGRPARQDGSRPEGSVASVAAPSTPSPAAVTDTAAVVPVAGSAAPAATGVVTARRIGSAVVAAATLAGAVDTPFPDAAPTLAALDPIAFDTLPQAAIEVEALGPAPMGELPAIDIPSLPTGAPDRNSNDKTPTDKDSKEH
jgi:hypothetical protein